MFQSLESLESRRLMTVTASAFHNTLYVWGDAGNNGIAVEKSGSSLVAERYVSGSGYVPFFTAGASYGVTQIRIMGYAGADTITIAQDITQTTTMYGGPGADWIEGGGGTNYLWGHGDWADDPSGAHNPATDDNAADYLIGGKGANYMFGQGGNDAFFTSTEAATTAGTTDGMYGGNGDDTFETSRPNGNATAVIFGQNGNDTFSPNVAQPAYFYGGTGWDSGDYSAFGQAAYIKADGVTHAGARTGPRNQVIDTDVERLVGTPYNDYFSGRSSQEYMWGGGGSDEMYGNGGNDVLFGEAGNDSIHGGDGNDSVYAGDGNDAVWGDAGAEYISGGNGNDVLRGGDGNDSVYGEAGNDSVYGDLGNDELVGGAGSDHLFANDGQFFDNVYGDNKDGSSAAGNTDVATIDSAWIFSDHTVGVESFA